MTNRTKFIIFFVLIKLNVLAFSLNALERGEQQGLMDTHKSPHTVMSNWGMDAVKWTNGFWADRFNVCKDTMLLNMWDIFNNVELSHAYRNFEIAAGYKSGEHVDPPFFDGDMYKWLEGVAAVYAITKNKDLDKLMDRFIETIGKAQREDGYIHTATIIMDKNNPGAKKGFEERLHFETYNMGHLMTAACIHYRVTGKKNLLNIAIKATDFLYKFHQTATIELARSAICPSHYMGVIEMYRTTRDPRYLELAKNLIAIRGMVENGTDDNQDRIPFLDQRVAMGHAVRANYLYAGAADVYLETGDDVLLKSLNPIWDDVTKRKMYITGGCGALYDGTSPDGTSYEPDSVQKVHQSYGRAYQLPQETAHNETCANIGNMLWNYRMLQLSGDAKYADIVELTYYNSILSGISLDGKEFFYTNALSQTQSFPYNMRWGNYRQKYLTCFCCPPNTVRTIAEASNYAYAVSDKGIYLNLYGANELSSTYNNKKIKLVQSTDYPWNGKIDIKIDDTPSEEYSVFLRIPGWCEKATIFINGKLTDYNIDKGYAEIRRKWTKNDELSLNLDIHPRLVESNPLVEESRNQLAVMYSPLVYCLESQDIASGASISDIIIPIDIKLEPEFERVSGSSILFLKGIAKQVVNNDWSGSLYREVKRSSSTTPIKLIPYYAWGNREKRDMSVWLRAGF